MKPVRENEWSLGETATQTMTYKEVAGMAANLIRRDGPDQHFIIWHGPFDCAQYSHGEATYDPDMNHEGHSAYVAAAMRNATEDWHKAHQEATAP